MGLLLRLLPFFVLMAVVLSARPCQAGTSIQAGAVNPYRLPKVALVSRYDIELVCDMPGGKFTGKEKLALELSKPTQRIVLNSRDLSISDVTLVSGKTPTKGTCSIDHRLQQVQILLDKPAAVGKHELNLSFSGRMSDKLSGLYRSKYKTTGGGTAYFACTQFEPSDARLMFPCFDEPDMKSVFKLDVTIDKSLVAISNQPIESESIQGGKKVVHFEATPAMSSYLLALAIGDFKANEPIVSEGVPIRVWSLGRDIALGDYARDHAGQFMTFLSNYFKVPYGWKKLDLIAIPDFEAGAMENPGAITFRETLLLVDKKTASLEARQNVDGTCAHEMAHLWFGDLVTMKWWDDLWLNEAFATWMSVKTVSHVMPEWHFLSYYGMERLEGLHTDEMHSTRAIHASVRDPLDARQMFDSITYQKGSAILRMLEMYIGEDAFREGVAQYMQDHKFANATGSDLWNALGKASGKPVPAMMDAWTNTPGCPLLSLTASGGELSLKQERFFLDGSQAKPPQLWKVPLGIRYIGAEVDSFLQPPVDVSSLISDSQGKVALPSGKQFFANSGGYGFYRTMYPRAIVDSLVKALPGRLTAVERLTFLSDQYSLAVAGKIPVPDYMAVLAAFANDEHFLVWETITEHLSSLHSMVAPAQKTRFAAFVTRLLSPEFERLSWNSAPGESDEVKLARQHVLLALGTLGQDANRIKEARKLFADYIQNPESVAPDLQSAITSIVAYNGDAADFEKIKKLWKMAKTPEIEHRNLYALAEFQNPQLLRQLLDMTITEEVPSQDGPKLIARALQNHGGAQVAWDFVRQNWGAINKRFAPEFVTRIVGSFDAFVDGNHLAQVKQFVAAHPVEGGTTATNRMLERFSVAVNFNARAGKLLNKWLAESPLATPRQ